MPSEPAPKPEPIDFKVLASRTQRMKVTEAPEMAGLPPIKGTINVTVQMVKDPGLPDPPPPLPALPPDDPLVIARMKELRENYHGPELVFLSATVGGRCQDSRSYGRKCLRRRCRGRIYRRCRRRIGRSIERW